MLRDADLLFGENEVNRAVTRLAVEITAKLADTHPLVRSEEHTSELQSPC